MKVIETEKSLTVAAGIPNTITEAVHKAVDQDENRAKEDLCRLVLYTIYNHCKQKMWCSHCMFWGYGGECVFYHIYLRDKNDLDETSKLIASLSFTENVDL